ncbi:hypothetical protein KSS87_021548 [Heliosperma pusillum]|nr:hypothetical protein KSS87_021548 [Heliosperma pusillum]
MREEKRKMTRAGLRSNEVLDIATFSQCNSALFGLLLQTKKQSCLCESETLEIKHPSALSYFERITSFAKGKKIAVFLDYDGTLSPIVDDPDKAFMSDDMRNAVRNVAKYFPTAIISGRSRDKVYELVGLRELYYAGSHGMDIVGPKHKVSDAHSISFNSTDLQVFKTLVEITGDIKGVNVENHKFCTSVHYRNVNEKNWPTIAQRVHDVLKNYPRLWLTHGRKVLEVRPVIDWDKGKAVEFLLESLGDDKTDEDAFKVLRKRKQGYGILVSPIPKETKVFYSLKDPLEVTFCSTLVGFIPLYSIKSVTSANPLLVLEMNRPRGRARGRPVLHHAAEDSSVVEPSGDLEEVTRTPFLVNELIGSAINHHSRSRTFKSVLNSIRQSGDPLLDDAESSSSGQPSLELNLGPGDKPGEVPIPTSNEPLEEFVKGPGCLELGLSHPTSVEGGVSCPPVQNPECIQLGSAAGGQIAPSQSMGEGSTCLVLGHTSDLLRTHTRTAAEPGITVPVMNRFAALEDTLSCTALFSRLKNVKVALQSLHKRSFSGIGDRIISVKKQLDSCQIALQLDLFSSDLIAKERALLLQYNDLTRAELDMLFQRAKITNIKKGDYSSKYFYSKIAVRRHYSTIGKLLC